MKPDEVKSLAADGIFQNSPLLAKIEETHISWVLLSKKDVFKIKKPLKLSFLDFSTAALRQEYCEREVRLNNRFTDIYLSVLPVKFQDGQWFIGGNKGKTVDYAVHMKRMASSKRMDKLLSSGKVSEAVINSLAKTIADFHREAVRIVKPFDLTAARNLFNDLAEMEAFAQRNLKPEQAAVIGESIQWSNDFLKKHDRRMQQRIGQGFKRDVHGDLHSGNIFLYKKPVLFDCIEFNDVYRQIDVLYEIAFLYMDLEASGYQRLAKHFLNEYNRLLPCMPEKEDQSLFNYYVCLRANIRVKVHGIGARNAGSEEEKEHHTAEAGKYLSLMKDCMLNAVR